MLRMPGKSYVGAAAAALRRSAGALLRLRLHVAALAARERNADLERPARYIEQAFAAQGYNTQAQTFRSGGRTVRNIEAGAGPIIVGAHYDTVPGSPGADDNASGIAVLLELAAMKLPVRFVAFANEEAPYFLGEEMGSFVYARERAAGVRAMFSLEMLGYYRDQPGSQRYPAPLGFSIRTEPTSSLSSPTWARGGSCTVRSKPFASTRSFRPKASPPLLSFPA